MKKPITVSGKRKTSIAKATIKPGKGVVRINSIPINIFEPEIAQLKMKEPLILAGEKYTSKVDIKVSVKGGGWMSQAEAVRNAIAKALVAFFKSKDLEKIFLDYDRHLLVADTRRTEPQKPYRSAARRGRQTSKR